MSELKDKIKDVKQISSDVDYLKDEYERIKLWGDCPDGDVKFEKLAAWLVENEHVADHIIKTCKKLNKLT